MKNIVQFKIGPTLVARLHQHSLFMEVPEPDQDGKTVIDVPLEIYERLNVRFCDASELEYDDGILNDADFEVALGDLLDEVEEQDTTIH